jgi:uncharacterized protein YbjT (DUF2867 family)
MKKAILIGATGLIGTQILKQLLDDDDNYSQVTVLARRTTGVSHPKLKEVLIDFDDLEKYKSEIVGDVLFSTMGTTKKKAGSEEVQYKVDYTYQFNTAKLASDNGVKQLVLLSSAGASSKSKVFYSRIKGELDEAVQQLNFESVYIIRPSMLTGDRKEFRLAEKIITPIMYAFMWIPGIRKYRPIKDVIVAKSMINSTLTYDKLEILELEAVFKKASIKPQ